MEQEQFFDEIMRSDEKEYIDLIASLCARVITKNKTATDDEKGENISKIVYLSYIYGAMLRTKQIGRFLIADGKDAINVTNKLVIADFGVINTFLQKYFDFDENEGLRFVDDE